jgi:hypothetical protein
VDRAELTASLDSLVHGSPTPEARNCVVQVAAKLPPSRVLQDTLVQWSKDPGPSLPPVTSLVRDGLVDSTFSRQLWVRTAADGAPRARDVVQTWGAEHFDVSSIEGEVWTG